MKPSSTCGIWTGKAEMYPWNFNGLMPQHDENTITPGMLPEGGTRPAPSTGSDSTSTAVPQCCKQQRTGRALAAVSRCIMTGGMRRCRDSNLPCVAGDDAGAQPFLQQPVGDQHFRVWQIPEAVYRRCVGYSPPPHHFERAGATPHLKVSQAAMQGRSPFCSSQ